MKGTAQEIFLCHFIPPLLSAPPLFLKKGEKKEAQGIFVEGQEYWIKLLCSLKDRQWDTISAKPFAEEITFTFFLCYQICTLINNDDL